MLKRPEAVAFYARLPEGAKPSQKQISALAVQLVTDKAAELYRLPKDELAFGTHEFGKPYFKDHPEVKFNISHSGRYILFALSALEIGVDVQEKRVMDVSKLGPKVFSEDEYREFLMHEDRQEEFFRCWVLKEAYVKWTGQGLLKGLADLPMTGWHQYIMVDTDYFAAIWAGRPLELSVDECLITDAMLKEAGIEEEE